MTANTEGAVFPCEGCGIDGSLGGLARRATAIASIRQAHARLLVLDAGNAFFGDAQGTLPDGSSAAALVGESLAAMGYDAVNLSWRDLRRGQDSLRDLAAIPDLVTVSANLLDADDAFLASQPWVIIEDEGTATAILGLTEPPVGLDYIPRLQRMLQGTTIQPPEAALTLHAIAAKERATRAILLWDGSLAGLATLLKSDAGRAASADWLQAVVIADPQAQAKAGHRNASGNGCRHPRDHFDQARPRSRSTGTADLEGRRWTAARRVRPTRHGFDSLRTRTGRSHRESRWHR